MPVSKCGNVLTLLALSAPWARSARVSRSNQNDPKDCFSKYDGKTLFRWEPCTTEDVEAMSQYLDMSLCALLSDTDLALPADGCASELAVCNADAVADVEEQFGHRVTVASRDAGAYYREKSGGVKKFVQAMDVGLSPSFYSQWRDLDDRMARVEAIVAGSGGAATIETAGLSLEGRPIKLVRFRGKGYSPGMRKVVFTFNLHAREWISGMAGIYALEQVAELAKNDDNYFAGMEVVIVPMANPDGFLYTLHSDRFHRKNMRKTGWFCRGVDVNRNFDIHWGEGGASTSTCSDAYQGPKKMSEPETNVLASIMKESKMSVYLDVHAYSQIVMEAWAWTTKDHPRKAEYRDLGKRMKDAIEAKHGAQYREGAIAQILYPATGSTSDYAAALGALGFAYELRPGGNQGAAGFAPPEEEIILGAEECWEGLLQAIEYTRKM